MRKRYRIGKFSGMKYIEDNGNERVFAFGPGFDWFHVPHQQYRAEYTNVDAIHVVEWLNERAAGYPHSLFISRSVRS